MQFKDALLPIEIKLTAFNPFIPLDPKNSGLPVIIFQFQVKNITKENIEVIILGNVKTNTTHYKKANKDEEKFEKPKNFAA